MPINVVKHPRRPQMHCGPFGSMEVCPISPAMPPLPRKIRPLMIKPAPMPVATLMYARSLVSEPAPHQSSANAPRLASLSTNTGRPKVSGDVWRCCSQTIWGRRAARAPRVFRRPPDLGPPPRSRASGWALRHRPRAPSARPSSSSRATLGFIANRSGRGPRRTDVAAQVRQYA